MESAQGSNCDDVTSEERVTVRSIPVVLPPGPDAFASHGGNDLPLITWRRRMKTTLSLAETAKCHIHYGDEPLVSAPDDPTADESGMIPISRSIMESHLGRKLKYHRKNNSRNEEVHHLDMNRGNNSLENLHVPVVKKNYPLRVIQDSSLGGNY
jgi:hypothetical protein